MINFFGHYLTEICLNILFFYLLCDTSINLRKYLLQNCIVLCYFEISELLLKSHASTALNTTQLGIKPVQ